MMAGEEGGGGGVVGDVGGFIVVVGGEGFGSIAAINRKGACTYDVNTGRGERGLQKADEVREEA